LQPLHTREGGSTLRLRSPIPSLIACPKTATVHKMSVLDTLIRRRSEEGPESGARAHARWRVGGPVRAPRRRKARRASLPPPPSRTNWTRLGPLPVLTGRVYRIIQIRCRYPRGHQPRGGARVLHAPVPLPLPCPPRRAHPRPSFVCTKLRVLRAPASCALRPLRDRPRTSPRFSRPLLQ
jgi:hypothetical protein